MCKIWFNDYHIHINFAYQTFKWDSESSSQAAVHCVIVGFAGFNRNEKWLFTDGSNGKIVSNISPYLVEGEDIFVVAEKESLCGMSKMSFGNQPRDGGFFVIKEDEWKKSQNFRNGSILILVQMSLSKEKNVGVCG